MTNDTIKLLEQFQRFADSLPSCGSGYDELDIRGMMDDLGDAVRNLDSLSCDLRAFKDALKEFAAAYDNLAFDAEALLPEAIDLGPNQYWRLEPYPWPGADPEPLIKL